MRQCSMRRVEAYAGAYEHATVAGAAYADRWRRPNSQAAWLRLRKYCQIWCVGGEEEVQKVQGLHA